MIRQFACLIVATGLTSCSSPEDLQQELDVKPEVKAAAIARAVGEDGRSVSVENDKYEFRYTYPQAAGALAGLKAMLDADLEKAQAELVAQAQEAEADATEQDYPYRPHALQAEWKVVADLDGWLSLSRSDWTYSGGAHGNSTTQGLIWDKAAAQQVQAAAMFVSPASLNTALRPDYCAALDVARSERRGEVTEDGDVFADCPALSELTLLIGSSNGLTFDRIGLIADPYVAGSYAEGPYDVTVPVTDAILEAVKPQYSEAFSVGA